MRSLDDMRPIALPALAALVGLAGLVWASPASSQTGGPLPKGMSTKQPGETPPESIESLRERTLGAPQEGAPSIEEKDYDPSPGTPAGGSNTAPDYTHRTPQPPALPSEPQLLRYSMTRPLVYSVRATSRLAVRDRPDMTQVYDVSNTVRYTPLAADADEPVIWGRAETLPGSPTPKPRVLVEVESAYGAFEKPALLGQTERTHQILRRARLSYQLDARGGVADVRVHSPTNPLARASLGQAARLATLSQPMLPTEPVSPGDTWTQEVVYRDGEGLAQFSQDSVNTYELERWRACGDSVCAQIKVTQAMKSAGRMSYAETETRGASVGSGDGIVLFDLIRGEVYKSSWLLKGQGQVTATQKLDPGQPDDQLAQADVLVEIETSAERVDTIDGGPPPVDVPARAAP